ncbi:MAG: hypothetical protein P8016_12630 [Sedimentisphaerales bacterium]
MGKRFKVNLQFLVLGAALVFGGARASFNSFDTTRNLNELRIGTSRKYLHGRFETAALKVNTSDPQTI